MSTSLQQFYQSTAGGFGAIASAFIVESLQHMIVWLIVMFSVIFADLISGLMKCYKLRQKIRPSRACRDTITKAVSYFAFVVCACMIDVANGGGGNLEKYCCLFVIVVEGVSITGNILKSHGYDLNVDKLVAVVLSKKMDISSEEADGIITKEKKQDGNL